MFVSHSSVITRALLAFCLILYSGVEGCNKQCDGKSSSAQNATNENQVIAEIVNIINEVCQQGAEEGSSLCNHTALMPAGLFSERPVNVTLKYSDIVLEKRENELHQNKGLVTASISFSYSNFTVAIEDGPATVLLHVKDNQFESTFTLKIPTGDGNDDKDCFFEWNHIEVQKFTFSITSNGPEDRTKAIVSKFQKAELQDALNSKPFLSFLNQEMSVCNKNSFLHDITSAFILIVALKGLGSLIGSMFQDIFCV